VAVVDDGSEEDGKEPEVRRIVARALRNSGDWEDCFFFFLRVSLFTQVGLRQSDPLRAIPWGLDSVAIVASDFRLPQTLLSWTWARRPKVILVANGGKDIILWLYSRTPINVSLSDRH
jgi:hypothetical protein